MSLGLAGDGDDAGLLRAVEWVFGAKPGWRLWPGLFWPPFWQARGQGSWMRAKA